MNLRYKLLKEAKRTGRQDVRQRYKTIRNEVTKELRRCKAEYYNDQFQKVKNTKSFWKLINKASNTRVDPPPPAIRRDDGTLATSDKEKAELLNSYFASIGENQAKKLPRPTVPIQTLYTKVTPTIASIDITQETVRKYIETLNPQKATGPDGISPKLLKLAGQSVTAPLSVIFNQSLRETSVPSTWKCARINTTHKKGDITERENYRPLSILSVPSKIMEKCVVDKLVEHTSENNNLVNSSQWAYKKGLSTELLLVNMTEKWRSALDQRKPFVLCSSISVRLLTQYPTQNYHTKCKRKESWGTCGNGLQTTYLTVLNSPQSAKACLRPPQSPAECHKGLCSAPFYSTCTQMTYQM